MLVYANQLFFPPTLTTDEVIGTFVNWLGRRVRVPIDLERVIQGIRALKFRDNSLLTTSSTFVLGTNDHYPFLFNATYSHNDVQIVGRRWTFEMGVRQPNSTEAVECTILLKTDERSVMVRENIEVSCPTLTKHLLEMGPVAGTPGANLEWLTLDTAKDFLAVVTSVDRRVPVLLMSCDRSGSYFESVEKIQPQILGLCHIFLIPHDVDSYKLEQLVGRERYTYNGGARILWLPRPHDSPGTCPSTLFIPSAGQISGNTRYAVSENPILAAITDHLNVPLSLRHISRERVSEQVIRSRLERIHPNASLGLSSNDADIRVYEDLLKSVDDEIKAKDREVVSLRENIEALTAENARIRSLISGYGYSGQKAPVDADVKLLRVREAILSLYGGTVSLTQSLEVIQSLFPERVEVLDAAFSSAYESDEARFQLTSKAADLLINLVTKYWEALASGGTDQQAKECFGAQSYNANEGKLSARGRAERTFLYKGEAIFMDNHLKIGGRDSLATTLRIHFAWFSSEKRIVIGHCGRHLEL